MQQIAGKVAIVTGASRGLGPIIARALARRGMDLALAARSADELQQVADSIAKLGVRTLAITADVTTESGRDAIVERTMAELGPIAVLVNNAGIENTAAYDEQDPAEIARIVEVNLVAPMLLSRAVLPSMLARGEGHIVNMASLAGKAGLAYDIAYSSSKGGLIQFTEGLRAEYHGRGVSASVICPGFVEDVGMYANFSAATGATAPRMAGTSPPSKVVSAVVRAIRRDVPEIIVNPGPMQLVFSFAELSPGAFERVFRAVGGTHDMFRRAAEVRKKEQQ